ncbi:PPE domain-containing protein, partial [Prauserella salsuginis]
MSQPGNSEGNTTGPVGTGTGSDGANLSPQQREAMYQAQAQAQYGNAPFGMPMGQLVAEARASGMNDQQIKELSQDAEVLEGLNGSDQNYPGVDHQTMYQYVHQDLDSGQTTQLSDAWSQLVTLFQDFDGKFNEAVQQSQHHWEGESAEAARGYVRSLGSWSNTNSQQAQLASEAVYAQSNASENAKNTMPEPVETNGLMKDFGSAVKDNPMDPIGAFNKAMETREKADAAHQEAAQVMSTYDQNLYDSASKQPAFSPPPEFGGAGGGDGTGFKGSGVVDISGGDTTSTSGYSGGQPGGPVTGGGPTGGGSYNSPSGNSSGVTPTPTPIAGRGPSTGAGQLPGTGPQGNNPMTPRVPTTGGPGAPGMGPAPVGPMGG